MAGISSKALKPYYAENKYKFNGENELQEKEFNDGSGLELYNTTFSMYDPQIGRFWQPDPMADWNEDWSPYSFVNDNPISFSDPFGLLSDSLHAQMLSAVVVTLVKPDCKTCSPNPSRGVGPPPSSVPAPVHVNGNNNNPTPSTNISGGIHFANGANQQVVSQYTLNTLEGIMQRSGNPNITITSTQRTPEGQADAMLNNIMSRGVDYNLRLYGLAGDQVVNVAADGLNNGLTRNEILINMVHAIRRIGPGRVSRHSGYPAVINVLDISPASIRNRQDFVREIRASNIFLIQPPRDPAFHLEISQPQC